MHGTIACIGSGCSACCLKPISYYSMDCDLLVSLGLSALGACHSYKLDLALVSKQQTSTESVFPTRQWM
jgi:hypothetical protein